MKTILALVGSRANYSSIKSVLRAIDAHSNLELLVVVAASALLDRYGSVSEQVELDGFEPVAKLHMLIEGETPLTMAKSTGLGLIEISTVLERLSPNIVITVGDRFETMATTLAAAYMNIPIAHTMGGEISGNIDESIRHAVTKFAHIHFPATRDAYERIIRLGEEPSNVHLVGCPRIDVASEVLASDTNQLLSNLMSLGVGHSIDLDEPFLILSQHPVTSEYGSGERQITASLQAIRDIGLPTIVLWPNADAGADDIARGIRKWREKHLDKDMHFSKNIPFESYLALMSRTACLIGNSSSGIREGAFIGTPTVNIGTRQSGRERAANTVDVDYDRFAICRAIESQISHGRYSSDQTYGDGHAGPRIATILAKSDPPSVQKRIAY